MDMFSSKKLGELFPNNFIFLKNWYFAFSLWSSKCFQLFVVVIYAD